MRQLADGPFTATGSILSIHPGIVKLTPDVKLISIPMNLGVLFGLVIPLSSL